MFSWYKYLIFPHLDFCSGNRFLNAPFPDHCLLVPFSSTFDLHLVQRKVSNDQKIVQLNSGFEGLAAFNSILNSILNQNS